MNRAVAHADATARPAPANKPRGKGRLFSGLFVIAAVMISVGLLVYADAAEWFSAINQRAVIDGYSASVETTPDAEREALLAAAYHYNDTLVPGPLLDPFITEEDDETLDTPRYRAYEELLRVSGSDAIGTVNYPDVDIVLPIFHGTTPKVISAGVGHLYGTSMPVGGPGTHSALTSHSGLKSARLFTNLLDAQVGQILWISVLGEDHYYEVRSTEIVEPNQVESVQIIPGEDWVTLFTCEPIGINSHRFMVHAQRIDDPNGALAQPEVPAIGFPWWALWFVLSTALTAFLMFPPGRKKKDDGGDAEAGSGAVDAVPGGSGDPRASEAGGAGNRGGGDGHRQHGSEPPQPPERLAGP